MAGKQERKLEDRFIENVSRYPSYVFAVIFGGLWMLIKPLTNLYKKSKAAAAAVTVGFLLVFAFIFLTLKAMTGDVWLPANLAT